MDKLHLKTVSLSDSKTVCSCIHASLLSRLTVLYGGCLQKLKALDYLLSSTLPTPSSVNILYGWRILLLKATVLHDESTFSQVLLVNTSTAVDRH